MREVIKITRNSKINIKRNKLQTEKGEIRLRDIPFVRVYFEDYSKSDISYLMDISNKFSSSGIIVETRVKPNLITELEALSNYIKFVYISPKELTIENLRLLEKCRDKIDRVILQDDGTLTAAGAIKLTEQLATATNKDIDEIGICNSPYSYYGNACLTALVGRKLLSKCCVTDGKCSTPSHLDETAECGCLHHIEL